MANAIRALSMDAVEAANSGHPGMPMGMADVATVLFTKALKYDAGAPGWPDRDRFVLSAGHGSMLLYALLYLTGAPDMTLDEIKRFRQLGSKTAGHPEYGYAPGIETTTGPLGQGLATAVGMALAERMLNAEFGDAVVDHRTYVIAGDGCLMEGISHEAIDLAGHLKLNRLIVLFDDNAISIDGATSLSTSMDQLKRFEAAGWAVSRIDGHNHAEIEAALEKAKTGDRPSLIACKTVIGFGAPNKQGTAATHGSPLGAAEVSAAREALGWHHPPFEVPDAILEAWREAGQRGQAEHAAWRDRHGALDDERKAEFDRRTRNRLPSEKLTKAIAERKASWFKEQPKLATRQSSQLALEAITPALPELVGGSADLTGSNGTRIKSHKPLTASDFTGRYIHYGIREHGMAAAMNGIALHGGFIPYGGTFLVFSDYCRPAIRLSALMHQRVVYVMTHDSIGLGEDGPTHQPVEHLAALRAIPNCLVFRPADAVETLEAWECALHAADRPSILALTRQNVPAFRTEAIKRKRQAASRPSKREAASTAQPDTGSRTALHRGLTHASALALPSDNMVALGAYVIAEADGERDVTLLATGSEVSLALDAAKHLNADGVRCAVVSMPSFELFRMQPESYRRQVLGDAPRVGIEAAVRLGWDEWLGERGAFVGMESFGASGPYQELYAHFGITSEAVVSVARRLAGKKA
jgi:transketolase